MILLLSLNLPVPCLAGILPSSRTRIRFNMLPCSFCAHLLGLAAIHQFWSHFLSSVTRAFSAPSQNFSLPVHSSDHIMSSHMQLFSFFPNSLKRISVLCMFLASSNVLAASSTSQTSVLADSSTPLCLVLHYLSFLSSTKIHFF